MASPTPSYSGSRLAVAAATPSAAAGGVGDLDDLFVAVDVADHAGVAQCCRLLHYVAVYCSILRCGARRAGRSTVLQCVALCRK